jgi:hypothetical protein
MVENGDGPSITLSVTYYSDLTRRRQSLYRANHWLRSEPDSLGSSERGATGGAAEHPL